jgi:hypothetical protein
MGRLARNLVPYSAVLVVFLGIMKAGKGRASTCPPGPITYSVKMTSSQSATGAYIKIGGAVFANSGNSSFGLNNGTWVTFTVPTAGATTVEIHGRPGGFSLGGVSAEWDFKDDCGQPIGQPIKIGGTVTTTHGYDCNGNNLTGAGCTSVNCGFSCGSDLAVLGDNNGPGGQGCGGGCVIFTTVTISLPATCDSLDKILVTPTP